MGLVRMQRRVVVDPPIELQRRAPQDPTVLDGDEHRCRPHAVLDVRDVLEVLLPRAVVRSDELAVGEGGHAAGFLVLLG